jgi:phosphoglycolate phosphatase
MKDLSQNPYLQPIRQCQHVIWDWNGTLIDDVQLCVDINNQLLADRITPIHKEHVRENFAFPVRTYYEKLGLELSDDCYASLMKAYNEQYQAHFLNSSLHDAVYETLEKIYNKGIPQSILSAHKHDLLLTEVAHHKVSHFFQHIVGLKDDQGTSKVESGKKHLETLGLKPQEVVLIGDTLHDLEVAQTLGVYCILVSHGYYAPERLRQAHALLAHNIKEVQQLLGL